MNQGLQALGLALAALNRNNKMVVRANVEEPCRLHLAAFASRCLGADMPQQQQKQRAMSWCEGRFPVHGFQCLRGLVFQEPMTSVLHLSFSFSVRCPSASLPVCVPVSLPGRFLRESGARSVC